ncbi:MAG: redoxin domain-containing protein [Thermoplasmata archaeon]|nr:redoxin domain-containing protein [Thermoplasmata archaeon]
MKKVVIFIVAILVLSSLTGCVKKEKEENGNMDVINTEGKIKWLSYEEGINESGKPHLLFFYSNETQLKKMENDKIIKLANDFVMIKVQNNSINISSKYNVSSTPLIIVLDKNGNEVVRSFNISSKEIMVEMYKVDVSEKDGILWMDYGDGMEIANETGKPVLLYFYYSSHRLCQQTESNLFTNKSVIEKSKSFVMIKINVGDDKNTNILYKYRFQYIYYTYNNQIYPYLPTVIFLNENKEILHRLITYDVYDPNNPTESLKDFLENMDKALKGDIWGYDFAFVTLDGKTKHLKDYRGKVVLVDMMATWCQPCRMQMAELKKVLQHYGKSRITIISIDVDERDDVDKIKSTFGNHINEWTFGIDEYKVSYRFWATSIPTLAIFDKYGRLQYLRPGLTQENELEKIIDEIM